MRSRKRSSQAVALLVAALGIVVQLVVGVDYPPVPPGLVILVVAAVLLWLVARTWVVLLGVVVALFILVGGLVADPGWGELFDGSVGAVVGTVVELAGLLGAVFAGAVGLVPRRGAR